MTILQGVMAGYEARDRREALDLQKKQTDAELISKGYDPNTLETIPGSSADVQTQQNKILLQNMNALQGKLAAQESDQGFLNFATTGDANELQKVLDNNPTLKNSWAKRGVQSVSNIDFVNDSKLLAQKGFSPSEYDTEEKQNILKKNMYKIYDGTNYNIGMLHNAVKETGITRRLGENQSKIFDDNFQQFRDFMAGPRSSANTAEGHKYEYEINRASEVTGVPPNLIAAMMNVESGGNPKAVSTKGATGLMQLMPETAKELKVIDITNPEQNILAGAQYMAKMLEKYNGDTRLALAAYNAGPGTVDKYKGIPPISETQSYVNKVLGNYANGESYYNAGADAIKQGKELAPIIQESRDEMGRVNQGADNRIATIQQFMQGNALASAGSSIPMEERKIAATESKAEADKMAAIAKLKTEGSTAEQKNLAAAEKETNALLETFGGEEGFNSTDFTDNKNFNKAWQHVVKINKLEGTDYTADDKKSIKETRKLLALVGPAALIGEKQTGMIDSYLSDVKKNVSDSVEGVAATSAYNMLRNSFRNALYGSALTDAEIASFNEAYGSRGQKLGPVLVQFKNMLAQVQSNLDTTARLGNPYTSKVLLGADQAKLVKIQDAIQARIEFLQGLENPNAKAAKKPTVSLQESMMGK